MAYYECTYKEDIINIGDSFTVILTGSHNITTSATVCYIYKGDKTTICLLGDTSLGTGSWNTTCNYVWNYTININSKEYTGTCRIPTIEQIYSKCAGYWRDFSYWTSTSHDSSRSWYVDTLGRVGSTNKSASHGTLPFIEILL